jgi:hypothetical protein
VAALGKSKPVGLAMISLLKVCQRFYQRNKNATTHQCNVAANGNISAIKTAAFVS